MIPIGLYQYSYLPLSETFIYRQMKGIAAEFDVRLYTMSLENLDLFPGFSPTVVPGKTFLERLSGRYRTTTFTPSRKGHIVRLLRGTKLLYVNFGHMALSMKEMAAEAGVPLVVFFHGVDASAFLRDVNYRLEYERSNFHTVFVNSESMRGRLQPHLPATTRVHIIRYGIDPSQVAFRLRARVPGSARFLQVSRLDHKKGLDVTLRVFARYLREVSGEATFTIVGEGPLSDTLRTQSDELGISNRVVFLGRQPQPRVVEEMQKADVLLQHSVTAPDGDMEGVPNVLIEAMACGLPVVSTKHSGIPELVEHGVSGFLVGEKDEEEYFSVLRSLPGIDVSELTGRGRATIEASFDSAKNNRSLCAHLREIAGNHAGR